MDLDAAYAECLRDAREHYENFPVASALLPSRMRPHVAAVYAFARAADDFADEGSWSAEQRRALIDSWRSRLHASMSSSDQRPPLTGEPPHTAAIFVALRHSIASLNLPVGLFEDLLTAFEQDVRVTRYETWDDLLDYCRLSAHPVGRLVLRIASHESPQLDRWSDAVCAALQLTNFWQDFERDLSHGRLYVPAAIQRLHGASETQLRDGFPSVWRATIEDVVRRTRAMFEEGASLSSMLRGRLAYEVRATWLGGMRILDKIEDAGFDVRSERPALGVRDAAWVATRLFT